MTFRTIGELSGNITDTRTFRPSDELPLPSCKIGIEIEMEAPPDTRALVRRGLWQAKEDGSLRTVNGLEGVELITLPVYGEDILMSLSQLEEELGNTTPSFGHRTSVHVHMDVADMNREDLIKLLLLYTSLERILFNYCGHNRHNNLYCLPFYKADHIKTLLYHVFNALGDEDSDEGDSALVISSWQKYTALNLLRILDLGTIEFRHHYGTIDSTRILEWVKIIQNMKRYAMTSIRSIDEFPDIVSGFSIEQYLADIFGREIADVLYYNEAHEDLIKGVRIAQDVLIYKQLDETQKLLQNKYFYKVHECSYCRIYKEELNAKDRVRDIQRTDRETLLQTSPDAPALQVHPTRPSRVRGRSSRYSRPRGVLG